MQWQKNTDRWSDQAKNPCSNSSWYSLFLGGNCLIVDLSLRKEYLAAAVDYVRFHSLMLDFKAVRQEYLESIAVTQ